MSMIAYPDGKPDPTVKEWLAVPILVDVTLTYLQRRGTYPPGDGPKDSALSKLAVLTAAAIGRSIKPAQMSRVLDAINLWQTNTVRAYRDDDPAEMVIYYMLRYVCDVCVPPVSTRAPLGTPSDILIHTARVVLQSIQPNDHANVRYAEVHRAFDAVAKMIGIFAYNTDPHPKMRLL